MTQATSPCTSDELKRSEERLESLMRIINCPCGTIQELLDFALGEAILLTESTIGYIYRYDEGTKEFTLNSWSKEVMHQCTVVEQKATYKLDKTGIWGEAVRQRKPLMVNEFSAPNPLKKGVPEGHAPLHRFLTVPVIINDEIVAVIGVANKPEPYHSADIRQLTLLMDSVWKVVASKHFEEKLRKKETMLSAVSKMAAVGGWEINCTTMHLEWTEEVYRIHEVDADFKPTVECAVNFYDPDSRPLIAAAVQAAIDTGKPFDLELGIITGMGNKRYVHAIGEAYRVDGTTKTIFGTFQDITRQKQVEDLLRKSEERLRLAELFANLGYWEYSFTEQKIIWSDGAYRLYGRDPLLGPPSVDEEAAYYPDGESERLQEFSRKVIATGKAAQDYEFQMLRPDGTRPIFCGSMFPIKDRDGKIEKLFGTFQDVTERKRMADELQKIQKLESLGILAGGIAHDFNNLLGGIYGFIDLAVEHNIDPKLHYFLSKAMVSISRGRDLTRQLITFARGGEPVRRVALLDPFIRETAQFALSGTSVSLSFDVPPDLWACNYDQNQIGQVIDNIVINAKQAMSGGGTIELAANNVKVDQNDHTSLKPGNYVRISITDHGIGMPKEIQPRIFDPFFTTKSTGHGLGLATCYSIVKRHGGAIDVESQVGSGSTFHILLPADAGCGGAVQSNDTALFKGNGMLIVMDDDEAMRMVMNDMFTGIGFTVFCTTNSAQTIEIFRSAVKEGQVIAGAFLDLTIPGSEGGKETVAELRKLFPDTPIFAVSGHSEDQVIAHPASFGFTGSLRKPFVKAEVMELLSRCFT